MHLWDLSLPELIDALTKAKAEVESAATAHAQAIREHEHVVQILTGKFQLYGSALNSAMELSGKTS